VAAGLLAAATPSKAGYDKPAGRRAGVAPAIALVEGRSGPRPVRLAESSPPRMIAAIMGGTGSGWSPRQIGLIEYQEDTR